MPLFRTILFAADFSERSREAFRVACSLAHERKTRIFVLHVTDHQSIIQEQLGFDSDDTVEMTSADAPGFHEALKDRLRTLYQPSHAVDVTYKVREGHGSQEILKVADQLGCDLIVLGTHGRTGLHRLLTGSVAEAVLRRAECPVLALRAPDRIHHGAEIKTILHPTDFSERADFALLVARGLARDHGARLLLLNVDPSPLSIGEFMVMPTEPHVIWEALEARQRRLDGSDLKVPMEILRRRGDAATEILQSAKENACDLIVMGTEGRSGLGHLFLGSVAESVLRRAECPVLTVKSPLPAAIVAMPAVHA